MAKYHPIHCPLCGQPLRLVKGPDGRYVHACGCPGLYRDQGGEDREIQSGALRLGQERDDGKK